MIEKIFIKNYQNVNDPKVRTAYGIMCSIIGIISNIILSASKMIIGFLSGSISIIADAVDNLSDCASSFATLFGFKLASQPADPEHPFGHERIEYLTAIIIAILILIIGIFLARSSIEGIINKSDIVIENFTVFIVILVGSIGIKFFQYLFYRRISKKINSSAIKASSQDSLNDCIKTFFVLIAIIIFKIWKFNIDSYLGLAVSVYIIINGIKLIKEASSPLIGEAPSKEFSSMVTEKILGYEGVLGIHDLVIHNYGPGKTFITVHVEVDSREDILISHDVIDNIERDFKEELNLLLTIHLDPIETCDELTNLLKNRILDVIMEIDHVIKFHDFRIVKGNTHINVLFDIVIPIQYKYNDYEIQSIITNKAKEECEALTNKTVNVIINVDKECV